MRTLHRGIAAVLTVTGLVLTAATAQAQTIITQWDFNSTPSDGSATTGVTTPSTGAGTASLIGGTTATFASGDANGGSTDPTTGTPTNDSAWNTTTYPASGANQTAGVQFVASTLGFNNITVTFDQRHSNTASRYWALLVTTNGTTYNQFALTGAGTVSGLWEGAAGDTWFNGRTADLSGLAGVANNPNFGVRIVSAFDPAGSTYVASNTGSTYGVTGTARFDMVTISGTAVSVGTVAPEPGTVALLATGLLPLVGVVRRRMAR